MYVIQTVTAGEVTCEVGGAVSKQKCKGTVPYPDITLKHVFSVNLFLAQIWALYYGDGITHNIPCFNRSQARQIKNNWISGEKPFFCS